MGWVMLSWRVRALTANTLEYVRLLNSALRRNKGHAQQVKRIDPPLLNSFTCSTSHEEATRCNAF